MKVGVAKSELFERKLDDLHSKISVSLADAIFGSTIRVNTPSGEKEVQVKEGSDGHFKITIEGQVLF